MTWHELFAALQAERALADDLAVFIAKHPESPWSPQLLQAWEAERLTELETWRRNREPHTTTITRHPAARTATEEP